MEQRWFLRFGLMMLVLMAVLAAPGITLAGGVAVVLDRPLLGVEVGQPFLVGFLVRSAHEDRSPISGLAPALLLTNPVTSEHVTEIAKPEGQPGHYAAIVTIPSAGEWRWQIQPFGTSDTEGLSVQNPLRVRAAGTQTTAMQPASATARVDVKAGDSFFAPEELTIVAGTTVHWENGGKLPHTVTAADGQFASGYLDTGDIFEYTFTEPGTYHYYCEYHAPRPQGTSGGVMLISEVRRPAAGGGGHAMVGTITVTAPAQSNLSVLSQQAAQPAGAAPEQISPLLSRGALGVPAIVSVTLLIVGIFGLALRYRVRSSR